MTDLDDTDRAILRALVADGGLNAKEGGAQVGLSQPAAWRRIRRLEAAGVIRGRSLRLDAAKLGFSVTVFCGVRLAARGRTITRACFLHDDRRLILPAFGAYTGGLRADHPSLLALFAHPARAILTGAPCLSLPLAAGGRG